MKLFYIIMPLIALSRTASEHDFDFNQVFTPQKFCTAVEKSNISIKCQRQLKESCNNHTVLQWMIDASSRFPYSGLNDGRKLDLGDYGECVRMRHYYGDDKIIGKYCIYGLELLPRNNTGTFFLSTCIPKVCSGDDYNIIFQNMNSGGFSGSFSDVNCNTNERNPLTTGAVLTIIIFSVCVMLMILCTIYDYYLQTRTLECSNKLLIAFSVITNGKQIFKTDNNSRNHILVFQGFRIISTMWIIFGHGNRSWRNFPLINEDDFMKMKDHWYSFYITGYCVTVDTFFYMSGFLLAYNYLKNKTMSFRNHLTSVPRLLLHRYLRIAPPVIMLYFLMVHLFVYCIDGPLAKLNSRIVSQGCEPEHIWKYFLFMQNYNSKICLVPTWYLSVDMQIYFLSPILLIPLCLILQKKGFTVSMIFLFAVNFVVLVITAGLGFYQKGNGYYDTQSRLITVFCGITMGTFMRQKQESSFLFETLKEKNWIINIICWIIVIPVMFFYVYFYMVFKPSLIYSVLLRPVWCICLSWVVYSCYHGYGSLVNWILTIPLMQIGGNLSYSLYLVQIFPLVFFESTIQTTKYFSNLELNYYFWDQLVIDIALAIFWYLAFEAPTGVLEKILFDSKFMASIGLGQLKKPAEVKFQTVGT